MANVGELIKERMIYFFYGFYFIWFLVGDLQLQLILLCATLADKTFRPNTETILHSISIVKGMKKH